MIDKLHIASLIADKIQGKLGPEQEAELNHWIDESPENKAVFEQATNRKLQLNKLEVYALFDKAKVRARLEDELFPSRKVNFNARVFLRVAAAILLPVLIATGVYFYIKAPEVSQYAQLNEVFLPGSQKAVLVLSSGEEIELKGDETAKTFEDGNVKIINADQLLNYQSEENAVDGETLQFNTLKVPIGGNYRLRLADGTMVYVNAESTLRFPLSFSEDNRDIYLEGEAYFEVTKTGSKFTVHTNEMDVQVLGTQFNVSAYPGDTNYKTTLVEGSVRVGVSNGNESDASALVLKPNEQATLMLDSKEWQTQTVNTSYYTSWIKGKIEFNNEDLEEVMKRLARWYDFEYVFENEMSKNYHFTGRLDKNENISVILEMLELTTKVSFEYKNGKVSIQ